MLVAFIGLFVLFVAGAAVMVITVLLRRGRASVKQASCGSCQYPIEGLTGMTCPECGGDLRQVGIITPRRNVTSGPLLWIILWSLILPFPAVFISRLIWVSLPVSWNNTRYITLHPADDETYVSVSVEIWFHDAPDANVYEWASFQLNDAEGSAGDPFVMNLANRQWRVGFDDAQPFNAESVTAVDVAGWMHEALDQREQDDYQAQAQALLAYTATAAALQPMVMGEQFNNVSINAVTRQSRPDWVFPLAWTFWIVTWLCGIWLIVRRTRRAASPTVTAKSRIIDIAAK